MIAVIFELRLAEGQRDTYLNLAARLREELSKVEGFLSIERFQSITDPGKMVSISFWENEEALTQWRQIEMHRAAQAAGRRNIFTDYRLRVAEVSRDYTLTDREQAPADSRALHG